MDMIARLPALEDAALTVLHQNAERLEHTGSAAQKTAASALIPAIEAELAARRTAKQAELAARRAAKAANPKGGVKRVAANRSAKPTD
jgi:hypothetical protein